MGKVLIKFFEMCYQPGMNNFGFPLVVGIPLSLVFVLIFLGGFFLLSLRDPRHSSEQISRLSFKAGIFSFVLYVFCQSAGMAFFYQDEWRAFAGKSLQEKRQAILGDIASFAGKCEQALPAGCRAQLITDLDIKQDPGMEIHRALAYLLYPIDIRAVRDGGTQCLVAFQKRNALSSVPAGYRVILTSGPDNFLAVNPLAEKFH